MDAGGGRGEALLFFRNTIQKYKTFEYRNTKYTNKEIQNSRNMTIQYKEWVVLEAMGELFCARSKDWAAATSYTDTQIVYTNTKK